MFLDRSTRQRLALSNGLKMIAPRYAGGAEVKVVAYVTASVDGGPVTTVSLRFDTGQPIMRFEFGDGGDMMTYETADPEFRDHVERMYGTIALHALSQP